MDFNTFKSKISEINQLKNGGIDVQLKMAPKIRKHLLKNKQFNSPVKAAVLAFFYPSKDNKTYFLLTKRAKYNGTHSAQISFPGGKFESNDISLINTAIRETEEEVGVNSKDIEIFREMTDIYIPPSNFIVRPFLGFTNTYPTFIKNEEVDEIIEISLKDFMNEKNISETILSTSYAKKMTVPCFVLNGYTVWGATAMILNEIRELFHPDNHSTF